MELSQHIKRWWTKYSASLTKGTIPVLLVLPHKCKWCPEAGCFLSYFSEIRFLPPCFQFSRGFVSTEITIVHLTPKGFFGGLKILRKTVTHSICNHIGKRSRLRKPKSDHPIFDDKLRSCEPLFSKTKPKMKAVKQQ